MEVAEKTVVKLSPGLRFTEFKNDWVKKDFNSIAEKSKDKYNPIKTNINFPCIEMESISKETSILLKTFNSLDQKSIKNKFKKGQVLFGKLRPNLRKYLISPFDGVCSSEIWVLEGKEVSNPFLFRLVQTNRFYSTTMMTIGSKMPRADWDFLSSSMFNIPSLPEQQKIASFLSAVDEKINQLNQKATLLTQYKKGVMQQLFSGKLRFKDENGEDFGDWESLNGNELFKTVSDKNHNSDLPVLAITQDKGAVPRDTINYNISVTEKSVESYKVVQKGDFIISLRSFQGGIEYSNYLGICSPAYNILRPLSDNVNHYFYKTYLKTPNYIRSLQSKLEGIRDGKMISFKYFSEIKLPVPSLKEQKKIANYLTVLDDKIEQVNTQKEKTKAFKKGLLQQMFV